ncbi:MAG: hypothetical protein RLZ55_1517 [Actinomycetota bacterium]
MPLRDRAAGPDQRRARGLMVENPTPAAPRRAARAVHRGKPFRGDIGEWLAGVMATKVARAMPTAWRLGFQRGAHVQDGGAVGACAYPAGSEDRQLWDEGFDEGAAAWRVILAARYGAHGLTAVPRQRPAR